MEEANFPNLQQSVLDDGAVAAVGKIGREWKTKWIAEFNRMSRESKENFDMYEHVPSEGPHSFPNRCRISGISSLSQYIEPSPSSFAIRP